MKILLKSLLFLIAIVNYALLRLPAYGQSLQDETGFTRADTLRGSITPQRAWWDVVFYDLNVIIHPEDSTINGYNSITYRVKKSPERMQIDLQPPLRIDRIIQAGKGLDYEREGSAFFVEMPENLQKDSLYTISIYYQGEPKVAENPPWDGGFIWAQDSLGNPWIATANQGAGASVWWPNKDHQSDEPDSMNISVTVPKPLVNVSNGRLKRTTEHDNRTTYTWHVSSPINNYNVAVNTGNYVNFKNTFEGAGGTLDLSYWVLGHHVDQAREQFGQVKPMLRCFEEWFGPYPFYEDGYKLVETPYLGMEHQSAVAYGNEFQNGYHGIDLSGTGWGLTFDFIIIHESAHEWWGNHITTTDIADMWVHEGFANYAEALYLECTYGREAGSDYLIGLRNRIRNDRPVIGEYGVHFEGSGDMYYKGSNMLHIIRQIVDDDATWKSMLRGLQAAFGGKTVTSRQIEAYMIAHVGKDLDDTFDQYLRQADIPVFQYYIDDHILHYRWKAGITHFDMPIKVTLSPGVYSFIYPTSGRWKKSFHYLKNPRQFRIDKNFYVAVDSVSVKSE